jgi:AcrR family transcriptional regulator
MILFWQYGIKSITMDDIAREVGVSKKTIYQFFKDKNELIYQCVQIELDKEDSTLLQITASAEDAIQEVILISKYIEKKLDGLNPSLLIDLQRHHHKAWELFQTCKNSNRLKMIYDNIERGKSENLYRKEINAKILAKIRVEQIHLSFNPYVFPPSEFDLKELHLAFLDHFLHGLVTEQGLNLVQKYRNLTLPNI